LGANLVHYYIIQKCTKLATILLPEPSFAKNDNIAYTFCLYVRTKVFALS